MAKSTEKKGPKSRAPSNQKNIYNPINATANNMSSAKTHSKMLEAHSNMARVNMMASKGMTMKKNSVRPSGVPNLQMSKIQNIVEKKPSQQ